jgi:hypothetical protein
VTPVDRPADAAALPALEPPADLVRQRFAERLDAQRQVGDVAVVQDRDATAVGLWRLGDAQHEHVRVAVEAGRGRASGEVDRPDIGQGSHTAESEQIARGRFPRRRSGGVAREARDRVVASRAEDSRNERPRRDLLRQEPVRLRLPRGTEKIGGDFRGFPPYPGRFLDRTAWQRSIRASWRQQDRKQRRFYSPVRRARRMNLTRSGICMEGGAERFGAPGRAACSAPALFDSGGKSRTETGSRHPGAPSHAGGRSQSRPSRPAAAKPRPHCFLLSGSEKPRDVWSRYLPNPRISGAGVAPCPSSVTLTQVRRRRCRPSRPPPALAPGTGREGEREASRARHRFDPSSAAEGASSASGGKNLHLGL